MSLGEAVGGPLTRAAETVRVFARNRPSVRDLWASRRARFSRLHATLPSTATTGEDLELSVQAWDQFERVFPGFEGEIRVETTDSEATVPGRVRFDPGSDGVVTVHGVRFETPGVQYLTLVSETGQRFVANPVRVTAAAPETRLYWGDIHLHSHLSDGVGSIERGMRFGRDVMNLDVVAYTDHDTMGFFIPPQLQRRRMHRRYFERMREVTSEFHDPGEFVTLFGYEWTKQPNVGGHINVYFDGVEGAELFDSLDPETHTYEQLWERLREWNDRGGTQALTVPHHPAESMYPFDFSAVDYDDELAPLVEVYSQWGSSERPRRTGNRYPLEMGQGEVETTGHHVQDALEMGHRVGMVASSDYHGPHPGHSLIHAPPHLPSLEEWRQGGLGWGNIWRVWNEPSYPGGLLAFRAPELTREAIFESLRTRRVYGTTQPHRILVDFRVGGVAVGEADSTLALDAPDQPRAVTVDVAGTNPLERVTVVKNNEPWRVYEGTDDDGAGLDDYTASLEWNDDAPVAGLSWDGDRGTEADVYYVRVHQAGGGSAWAGPIWVDPPD